MTFVVKRCRDCKQEKLACDGPQSEFSINTRRRGRVGWRPNCKPCYAAECRQRWAEDPEHHRAVRRDHYHQMMKDPDKRAARRRMDRDRQRRYRRDPVQRARIRRHQVAWRKRKVEADPDYFRHYQRMRYRLDRERQGHTPRSFRTPPPMRRLNLQLDPFARWLRAFAEQSGLGIENPDQLAGALDLVPRRVRHYVNGAQREVAFDVVDRALMNSPVFVDVALNGDGQLTTIFSLDDLYPNALAAAA